MVKAVVFDLGKVLLNFDYGIAARKIAARSTATMPQIAKFILSTPLILQYESGAVSSEYFYKEICQASGFRGTFEQFTDCFGDIFSPIEPMVSLQASLRQRGLRTYILSNTNDIAIRVVRRNFPFFAGFDGYILSYEHGSMKPEPKLYEEAERLSGRRGPEILYLDDIAENVAAGAARGWQVILQESPEKTLAAIKRLGLLNGN